LNVSFLAVKVPVTLPVRPSAQLIKPETREPSWVKMTSESPNPLPVVHHFPSILSTTPLGTGFLTVSFGALFGGGLVVVFGVVLVFGFASELILPPPGCARTELSPTQMVRNAALTIRIFNRQDLRMWEPLNGK
jgi:hypothetical protein